METNHLPEGHILRGADHSYRIEGVLGQGSFGITYLASTKVYVEGRLGRIETEIKVAVKEFYMLELCSRRVDGSVTKMSEGSLAGAYARKFRREAENLSKLSHPGIVKVLEVFETNGTCYYSMEYFDGGSLDAYVKRVGGLSEEAACGCIRQISQALAYMHSRKMLHLDLKPLNVVRSSDGSRLALIDFGLSKQYSSNGIPDTSTNIGLGTPGYAPLEQSGTDREKDFAPTLDVYALGATYYKLLTGETPPDASSVLNYGLPKDKLIRRGVSESSVTAIERAMASRKLDRLQSVREFLNLLPPYDTAIQHGDSIKGGCAEHTGEETKHWGDDTVLRNPTLNVRQTKEVVAEPERRKPAIGGIAIASCIIVFAFLIGLLFWHPWKSNSGDRDIPAEYLNNAEAIAGHQYVDLGLSVKWATCNVGASNPEDYGDYFAWGETSPKSSYDWSNLKYCLDSSGASFSKYNQYQGGTRDSRTRLELSDDAARVNWGGSWRMPTYDELDELRNQCSWQWTTVNGYSGYRVTSKRNGRSIFLPAAGFRYCSSSSSVGSGGYYWSSSLYTSDSYIACYLDFNSSSVDWLGDYRSYGRSVRAVSE